MCVHTVAGGIGRKGVDYIYIFLLYFDPMVSLYF